MQLPSLMEEIVTCLLLIIQTFQLKYWYLYFILMKFQLMLKQVLKFIILLYDHNNDIENLNKKMGFAGFKV
jgi:hypothetical protein